MDESSWLKGNKSDFLTGQDESQLDSSFLSLNNRPEKRPQNDHGHPEHGECKNEHGSISDYMRIFQYADHLDRTLFTVAAVCFIAAGAALPFMTLIFGNFTSKFDDYATGNIAPGALRSLVDEAVLYFIYLFIGRFIVSYVGNVCITIAATRTTRNIRQTFLESVIRQEVWHFDKENNGSISTQVTTNGNRIQQGIAERLGLLIQGIALFFSAFIVALSVQWRLSLITMSSVPAIIIVIGYCVVIDDLQESKLVRIYSQAAALAQEVISSIKTVHAFWAHDKLTRKYDEYLDEAHRIGATKSPNWAVLFSVQFFFSLAGTALTFWQGSRMYHNGEIKSSGTILTVVLSVAIGASAMSSIVPQIQAITNASSAAGELFSIIDKPSVLDPLSSSGHRPTACAGNIEIRNVSFAYPSRPSSEVIHQLNFSIPAGKTTALVGASGCGKSTIVALLERWYVPTSGEILLDGMDIAKCNTQWLRSNIRLVQQEPVLFRGTIFENVARGLLTTQIDLSQNYQMKLVQDACKSANAHSFIMDLPKGYYTEIGERASMLSGGQKQRIAIARSIISNPKILILDEATSALDPRAETIVQEALDRISVNKTTLVIAHKLATVKAADHIIVMSYGRVAEQGTHCELMKKNGLYSILVRAQDLGDGDYVNTEVHGVKMKFDHRHSLYRTLTGVILRKPDEERKQYPNMETINLSLTKCILTIMLEQKELHWWYAANLVACAIPGVTSAAQAVLFSRLIQVFTYTGDEAKQIANFYSLMLFIVALSNLVAYFTIGWACNTISQVISHRYRKEMFQRILNLDQEFFDRPENSSGALTSKLSSVPNVLQELISANIFLLVIIIINIVTSSTLAIVYGWKLGMVLVFGGLPVMLGAGMYRVQLEQKFENMAEEQFAESAALATEAVTAIRTVASLTMEERLFAEYKQILDQVVRSACRSLAFTMVGYALSQSAEFLIMALGLWYGSRLIASGEYTVEQFFVIFVAVVFGGQAAAQFFGHSASLTKAKCAANYTLWLRTLEPSICEDSTNKECGPPENCSVSVQNIEFSYKQRQSSRVLKGINMDIKPGSYIACVGPSGCGKSTLISILERFYDPISGQITIGSRNITSLSPRLYRSHMSLVQQEPTLYQLSVRENITLGLQYEPTDAEILTACRQANVLEFISSLPQGLETSCGGKGMQFSGGQRQRIAIARALVRRPRLLLLDEATSALDTQSERLIQSTLDQAVSSQTTIAVAHRLSTIRHADCIFVLSDGRVAERGTHEDLLKLRGRYYEMCLAQSLDRTEYG